MGHNFEIIFVLQAIMCIHAESNPAEGGHETTIKVNRSGTTNLADTTPSLRYATSATGICYLLPNACATVERFKHHFYSSGEFEARGPKDLIAIISTMLATLLGAILVKLNVLIVLSLISVGIGKLLLLLLSLKSQIFTHKPHQQPIVYEKIYYPHRGHRKEFLAEVPQGYYEDYPTYEISH